MGGESLDRVEELLKYGDVDERIQALTFVGEHRSFELTHLVIDLTLDHNEQVKQIARWSLSRIKSPESVPRLIDALTHPSLDICANAGWVLIEISRDTVPNMVVPDLIEVLFESDDSALRLMAYVILGEIGGAAATDAIEQYRRRGR